MGERTPFHHVRVDVATPYTVVVGAGTLEALATCVAERRVAVVTDENVGPHYEGAVRGALETAGAEVASFRVPAGEDSKSADRWLALHRAFTRSGIDRSSAVVALGGGVVGDLAGFVAATHLRGLPWYLVPTSLLAMVDASIGGKTAIDLPEGKNLVGAFWQPEAVVIDVRTLATLPERQFRQGAVELYKHGLLADPRLLTYVEDGLAPTWPDERLADAIARSVTVKAAMVARDEREDGVRAHLNLGHSLAHALEAVSGHALPHGDSVAYGLHFAALLARQRGYADLTTRTARLLAWERPGALPDVTFEQLRPFLARDKKNRGGRQRFVLLMDIGRPLLVDDVTVDEQRRAWHELRQEVHR